MRFSSSRSSALQLGVERGQRLVHQVDGRLAHQRPADRHALHLAARQPGRAVVELVVDAHQLRHLLDAPADLGLRHLSRRRAQREGQVLEHRQMRIERILLEHEGDVAGSRRQARGVAAGDVDRALLRLFQAGDQPQRRRLAGAGRPEQHHELAIGDTQVEVADRCDIAERFRDATQPHISHDGLHRGCWCGSPGRTPVRTATAARR